MRIRVPGQWADGWLYREHLLLWSRTNECYVLPLSELRRSVTTTDGPVTAALADYLIFRSDWKLSEQLQILGHVPGIHGALNAALADNNEAALAVDLSNLMPVYNDTPPGLALDSALYANRVYVATTEGLFESRFNPNFADGVSAIERRLEDRVAVVTAKYSAVNCSARDAGLTFAPITFDDDDRWWDQPHDYFESVAEQSQRHSWAGRHILNYSESSVPNLLWSEAVYERVNDRARFDEWRVLGFSRPADISAMTIEALRTSHRVRLMDVAQQASGSDSDEIEVLGNANYRLLIRWNETVRVLDVSGDDRSGPAVRPDRRFERARLGTEIGSGNVLSTHGVRSGFVIELDNEVRLLTSQASYLLAPVRAARVRTFEHSRRYRDVVLTVEEEQISIYGFLETTS
jgi:hypothetical protein